MLLIYIIYIYHNTFLHKNLKAAVSHIKYQRNSEMDRQMMEDRFKDSDNGKIELLSQTQWVFTRPSKAVYKAPGIV